MRIAVVGAGTWATRHLKVLANIEDAEIAIIADVDVARAKSVGAAYGAERIVNSLDEVLTADDINAVILCTPSPLHSDQAIEVLRAGKHVQVEEPVSYSWVDAQRVLQAQVETGLICMVSHTRRFNPAHIWIHNQIEAGKFVIQNFDVQTYFARRSNVATNGESRGWTDHLLWHQAAQSVDLFQYQTGEQIIVANAIQGPLDPHLGIAMDMSIQLLSETGKVCTLSLSFNNDLTLGAYFRYIGDTATYLARHDDLFTGGSEQIDVSGVAVGSDGIEIQDREFFSAIAESREPNSSIASVFDCYRVLGDLDLHLSARQ